MASLPVVADDLIKRIRRMANEMDAEAFDDADISAVIARYPIMDANGAEPLRFTVTYPPRQERNPNWIEGYDLHSAAADIWEEKAAVVAQDFDFNADGGSYQRSQVYEQYMKQARYHRSRRAVRHLHFLATPGAYSSVVGNINNPYE